MKKQYKIESAVNYLWVDANILMKKGKFEQQVANVKDIKPYNIMIINCNRNK